VPLNAASFALLNALWFAPLNAVLIRAMLG
jgi:hypothetical protein